jgi:hypothetical protein
MKKRMLLLSASFLIALTSISQTTFSNDPDSAVFLTKDIDHFWMALTPIKRTQAKNPFGRQYIDIGSDGVKGFTPYRIQNAEHLYATVKQRRADYAAVRPIRCV